MAFVATIWTCACSPFLIGIAEAQEKARASGVACILPYGQDAPVPESFLYRETQSEGSSTSPATIMRQLLEAVGMGKRVAAYPADIQNACATLDSENRRVIYYGSTWLQRYSGGDYWIKVGVLAHELGHHINFHLPGEKLNAWRQEYEADVFVGRAVRLLGGTLENALRAVSRQPIDATETHLARALREAAVRSGYEATTRSPAGTIIEATSRPPAGTIIEATTRPPAGAIIEATTHPSPRRAYEINGRWCLTPKRRELASLNINATHWHVDLQMYDPQGQLLPQPRNFVYAKIVGEPGPASFQIVLTFDPYLGAEGPFESVSERVDYMRFKSHSELEIFDQRVTRGSGESRPSGVSYPIRLVRCE